MNPYLGFQCGIVIEGELWFSSFWGNGLFRYDGKTAQLVDCFSEKGAKLFSDVVKYKNKLFFVPLVANNIYIYDLLSGEMKSISYKDPKTNDFVFAILYERYIYMFPWSYSGILKLNPETFDMEVIDDWMNEDFRKCQLSNAPYFRGDYVREGDTVYIPFCNAHAVFELHMDDGSNSVHDVGFQGYATIATDGKRFWMGPRKEGGIVSWDPAAGEISEYKGIPEGFRGGTFIGSTYRDGYVWIFPESANMVLKVDVATGEITEEKIFTDICSHKWSAYSVWNASFVYMGQVKDRVLLCSGKSSEVVIFDPETKNIDRYRLRISDVAAESYYEEHNEKYIAFREKRKTAKKGKSYFRECAKYGIEEFIEDTDKDIMQKEDENNINNGERIYQSILSILDK